MDLGINDKKALVLSSSAGLGRAVAEALATEGAQVFLVSRSKERLAEAAAAIGRAGGRVGYAAIDLAAPDAPRRIADAALAELGAVDILVNNSGGPPPRPAGAVPPEEWSGQFAAMALPIFEVTRLLLPDMRARRWGRLITIVSSGVVQPIPNLPVSNALRSAIVSWMKTLSSEVAADGVTVNVVAPGRIDTARVRDIDRMAAEKAGKSVDDIVRASVATIPAARYGTPEEFAAVVAFLASGRASYVTGSVVRVDGGLIRSL